MVNIKEVDLVYGETSLHNTNCISDEVTSFLQVLLLKAGSINMKRLEFEMRSYLWLPTIINQGNFNITSTAEIVSVGGGLVIPPGKLSRTNIKTMVAVEENRQKDVLWIIVGSVIGGLIILAVLIIVLWKVGFFKRKQPPVDGTS